ncbi:MAG: hypothetical protein KDB10_05480 [Acidimicrobiales bacterium]|nr:hypothetical protein [Acidimicrobiales bacterium]
MTRRTVSLLGLVALVVVWLAPVAVAATATAPSDGADVITVAGSVAIPAVREAPRVPRNTLFTVTAAVVVIALVFSAACRPRMMERLRHRFCDARDQWRALLLGAPPARA